MPVLVPLVEGQSEERALGVLLRRLFAAGDAPALVLRGSTASQLPIGVVLPTVEIEAWILAAIESVRGVRGIRSDAQPPADVESVRDAKGTLTHRMAGARGYVATDDMPAFFATMDLDLAGSRSPSMGKFVREIRRLSAA